MLKVLVKMQLKLLKVWAINIVKKILDNAQKSTADAIKTASKRASQKTAETTGDLIGNKIADKITSVSKKSSEELQNNDELEIPKKKRYISLQKRQQNIDELRLV